MKIIISGFVGFILMMSLISASSQVQVKDQKELIKFMEDTNTKYANYKSRVPGLENAIIRVKNNETRQHLENVLANITVHRREILLKLEDMRVKFEEKCLEKYNLSCKELVIEGRKQGYFLGFIPGKLKVEYRYKDGELIREKRVGDFLWRVPETKIRQTKEAFQVTCTNSGGVIDTNNDEQCNCGEIGVLFQPQMQFYGCGVIQGPTV